MSQTTPEPKLDYDTAAAVLLDRVFAPVFFNKLASHGIQPADESQAVRLLQLADRMRYADDVAQSKAAAQRGDLIDCAINYVDQALGVSGQPAYDPQIQKMAADASQDPLLRDAALLYQDAMRQQAAA